MFLGTPRREMKRFKPAMQASVVKSENSSRCTALTVRQTKRARKALDVFAVRSLERLIVNGQAK